MFLDLFSIFIVTPAQMVGVTVDSHNRRNSSEVHIVVTSRMQFKTKLFENTSMMGKKGMIHNKHVKDVVFEYNKEA